MKALISVYDKQGLEQFCDTLESINCEIYSTGGTLKYIKSKGYKVRSITEITNHEEILEGRVKTLHPKIHGGILGRRGTDDAVMSENAIDGIDLGTE